MTQERGSVSVLGLVIVAAGLVFAVAIIGGGQLLTARARAVNAADAAALAAAPVTFRSFGATGTPLDEGRLFAEANGAQLARCTCPANTTYADRTVLIEVSVAIDVLGWRQAIVSATSAAEFRPVVLLAGR